MNLTACIDCGDAVFDAIDGRCARCDYDQSEDAFYDQMAQRYLERCLARPRYVVAVWDCDRQMGGMEEGGWSYETGRLVDKVEVNTLRVADDIRTALEIEYPYTGQRGMYSKRGPDYTVRVHDRWNEYDLESDFDLQLNLIRQYPTTRPHYE